MDSWRGSHDFFRSVGDVSDHNPLIIAAGIGISLSLLALALAYVILSDIAHPVEVRSTAPRFMGLPPAPYCGDELSHKQWAKCMNVPYTEGFAL